MSVLCCRAAELEILMTDLERANQVCGIQY